MKSIVSFLTTTFAFITGVPSHDVQWIGSPFRSQPKREPSGYFNWTTIAPSTQLVWHTCYEAHECARLEVPLNWQQPEKDKNAAIAVIRLPAKVSRKHSKFGGSILINPGGPGGTGTDFLRWVGWEIQANVDGDKHFEIVSFDPRGTGNTIPASSCFESALDRQAFLLKLDAIGSADVSDTAFTAQWQAAKAFGEACSATTTKHLTTFDVAHDMIAMIDALEPEVKKPLLNYWGFSYGTFLGNTFASAFPDRIGRMVLDGVVDADDFVATGWKNNLINTEDAFRFLFSSCWQAGPEKCALAEDNLDDMIAKVEKLFQSLANNPLPVAYNGTIDLVTLTDIRKWLFTALYMPPQKFPTIAQQLQDLINGNTTSSAESLTHLRAPPTEEEIRATPPLKPTIHSWDNPIPSGFVESWDVSRLIACTDGNSIVNRTFAEHQKYLKDLKEQSPHFGGLWMELPTYCVHLPERLRPDNSSRFTGPFASRMKDYSHGASPILWIGNEADPVCPLAHAKSMSEQHEGSVVIEVKQVGHCSGPINPNQCVYKKVSQFFNHGVLPADGERVCTAELMPWS